jgi:FK506-binding protein 15
VQDTRDKEEKVQEMQTKVTELLERNQQYIQNNNQLLEKRNTSLQDTSMVSLEMTKAKTQKDAVEEEATSLRREMQVQQRLLEEAKQAAAESRSKLLEEQTAGENSTSQMQVCIIL